MAAATGTRMSRRHHALGVPPPPLLAAVGRSELWAASSSGAGAAVGPITAVGADGDGSSIDPESNGTDGTTASSKPPLSNEPGSTVTTSVVGVDEPEPWAVMDAPLNTTWKGWATGS